jgi:uncharacterized protein (DUF1800 family)
MAVQAQGGSSATRRGFLAGLAGAGEGHSPPSLAGLSSNALTPPFAAYVLGRLGFGPRKGSPYSIEHFDSLGAGDVDRLIAFVDEQLAPSRDGNGNVTDADVDARLAHPDYVTLGKSFQQLWTDYEVNGNPSGGPYVRDLPVREGERAVFVRAFYSRWQLIEQLADFWHDHFSLYGFDRYAAPTWEHWDREVIRKHSLGNFRTLLQKTFESPAMLYFLDNYINRAPSFNENYAREILELHTLGAMNYLGPELQQHEVPSIPAGEDGAGMPVGYVDADVYELARALTGWSFGNGGNGTTNNGLPAFINGWHDIGQKTVVGLFQAANTPPATEIAAFLDRIAMHPGTGRHIATKLARRFLGENPPQEVIDHAAHVFFTARNAADQLKQVVRAVLLYGSQDGDPPVPGCFGDIANFGNKVKRPFEVVVSALRAVSVDFTVRRNVANGSPASDAFMDRFRRTGHRPFDWRPPDGFPDASDYWMGSTAFVHAWRTIDWTLDEGTGNEQTPLAPLLATTLAEFGSDVAQHTPNRLADFWLTRCFGWAPDSANGWIGTMLHAQVRDFMCRNTDTLTMFPADVGIGAGPAGNTQGIGTNSGPNYWYNRLRGMVDCILFSPQAMLR